MLKIETRTSNAVIRKNGRYRPASAEFFFRNSGNTMVYINDMPIPPGDVFGRSVDTIIGMAAVAGKDIDIKETTEYEVRFSDDVAEGYETAFNGPSTPVPLKLCVLVTTEYKIFK